MATPLISGPRHTQAIRMFLDIWRSPQGRDLGRFMLEELGKAEKGEPGRMLNELAEIFVSTGRDLYCSDRPEQSR